MLDEWNEVVGDIVYSYVMFCPGVSSYPLACMPLPLVCPLSAVARHPVYLPGVRWVTSFFGMYVRS